MKPFLYAACYCEENIWHLCGRPELPGTERKVIWISSLKGVYPLWCQRAAAHDNEPVWWDYHVILLVRTDVWQVWDLDTTLELPVAASDYFPRTFRDQSQVAPLFRVMDAQYFRDTFSSTRAHMKSGQSGWLAPPPDWPVIGRTNTTENEGGLERTDNTFSEMLDFTSAKHGELLSYAQMIERFT